MPDISIPQARRIVVDTTGAQIVQEESPAVCLLSSYPLYHNALASTSAEHCLYHGAAGPLAIFTPTPFASTDDRPEIREESTCRITLNPFLI